MPTKFMLTIPVYRQQFTTLSFVYGAVLLGWLSTEDTHLLIVIVLGTGLSLLLLGLGIIHRWGGKTLSAGKWLPMGGILGGAAGFGAVWGTVLLMVFKKGWHSHAFPDFSAQLVAGMMARTFIWTLAGMLLGQSAALLRFILHPDWEEQASV